MEPRAEVERNSGNRSMYRAQKRASMSQAAARIRTAVKRNPEERLVALLYHITVAVLSEAYYSFKSEAAAGMDGVTREMYTDGLEDRVTHVTAYTGQRIERRLSGG